MPLAAGCGAGAEPRAPEEQTPGTEPLDLALDLDRLPPRLVDGADLPVDGSAPLVATLRSQPAQGVVSRVPGREGGIALRLPAYVGDAVPDGRPTQPLAAVAVRPVSLAPPHPLDPGEQPFTLGASFQLDALAGGTLLDAGNNLVQRGAFADASQYKLQLDERQPSCRVAGPDGEVLVQADRKVLAGYWYDVTCARTEDGLELGLTEYRDDGTQVSATWAEAGPTGDLSVLDPSVPMAVGGKLTATGRLLRRDTDQFNGMVDDVFLRIEG